MNPVPPAKPVDPNREAPSTTVLDTPLNVSTTVGLRLDIEPYVWHAHATVLVDQSP
jgi:hypothetical protein